MLKPLLCGAFSIFCCQLAGQNSWAIRPELQVNFMKSERYSNTVPFDIATPQAERYPNFMVFAEQYRGTRAKWSFGAGHFNSFFNVGVVGARNEPFYPFVGNSNSTGIGGAIATATYSRNILNSRSKSRLYAGGGATLWYNSAATEDKRSAPFLGNGMIVRENLVSRVNSVSYGLNGTLNFWWGNKKGREVMQVHLRYHIGFLPSFEQRILYDAVLQNDAGQSIQFTNEEMRFRLNGTSLQFGLSKTLRYFPRQRRQPALQ